VRGRRIFRGAFGHADEHPYRRLTADLVKLPLAVVVVVATARHAGDLSVVEQRITSFFTSLPDNLHPFLETLSNIGALWGVALVALAGLVARRYRLASVLASSGALAWFLGRFLGLIVAHHSVGSALTGVFDGTDPGGYPAVHLAVVGAVVMTAAPYLTRPVRRLGYFLVVLMVVATLTLGVGGLNDVAGALALAWGIAAFLHLALGSPAGRPTTAQVAAALAELNLPVERVELAPEQSRGFTLMTATTAAGECLPVRVYGRDAADTRLLAKAWRFVWYKDSGPTLTLTRLQQVEHEALCLYAARETGASVPAVVAAGVAGASAAVLVTRGPDGVRPLSAEDAHVAEKLDALWCDAGRLHTGRIAHGALDLEHVRARASTTVIEDFSMASVSAPSSRLDQDVAQLLVASASLVGAERAVDGALARIGNDVVGAALPYLQKPALSSANRRVVGGDKDLLGSLRDHITEKTGMQATEAIELRRITPLNIVMFVALVVAVWVVLAQVGSLSDLVNTLKTASVPWLALGFAFAVSTSVGWAFTTIGTVRQSIPLLPATLLQMSVSFVNLVTPSSAGSTVMNIRFLQKQGVGVGPATTSGLVAGLSGTVAQLGLFIGTALLVGRDLELSAIGGATGIGRKLIILAVFVGAVAVGVVVVVRPVRRWWVDTVWPQVVASVHNIWDIVSTPRQVLTVLGGAVAANLLASACLLSCLLAYGDRISFVEVVFVNVSSSLLTGVVPVPGGVGVAEATLVAGLTAFGVPAEIATATVVTHRLFTSYLPPIWGSQAMKWLVREGYL